MQNVPVAEQPKIVLAGLRNSGKSSLMNNIFNNEISIISPQAGTTTDPVSKSFELGDIGAVSFVDTAGVDDSGELGLLRVKKTEAILEKADIIIFVTKASARLTLEERELINKYRDKNIAAVVTFSDGKISTDKSEIDGALFTFHVDNISKKGIEELKEKLITVFKNVKREITPVEGLVKKNDFVLLVTPIDTAAPKGRLILPQVETIRDLLDRDCGIMVVKESELEYFYNNLSIKPVLAITDSQAFGFVSKVLPSDQKLTSFSILFARKKGDLQFFIDGIKRINEVKDGDRVLILESCNHHKKEDDIGSVKIPKIFREQIAKGIELDFAKTIHSEDMLRHYKMVINCAGCMVTRNDIMKRIEILKRNDIPATNYGIFLAWANGILERAIEPLNGIN